MSKVQHTLAPPNPRTSFLGGFIALLRNLWGRRLLLRSFVRRDVRLQYRGSAFGYVWSLLDPLLLSATYVMLYAILSGNASLGKSLDVFIGVISYTYFAASMNAGITSLADNQGMISAIYFPREIFAAAATISQGVIAVLSLLVTIPFMIWLKVPPNPYLLFVPIAVLMLGLMAFGMGLLLAAPNVRNRDVQHFFKFVTRAGMYLSPVLWSAADLVRKPALAVLMYNPLATPIELVRSGILNRPPALAPGHVISSVAFTLFIFVFGSMVFRRFEGEAVMKL